MFARARGGAEFPVACYGKLPCHPEYLRIGLGSPGSAQVVRWVERTHEALTKPGRPPTAPGVSLSFAAPEPSGRGVVVGVLRQSSDGTRAHPVVLFAEQAVADAAPQWHLVPLAARETWRDMVTLLDRRFPNVHAFAE